MKYIKLYENHKDIDPFNEEDWNEIENDGSFLYWLKQNYPRDKYKWENIKTIRCENKNFFDILSSGLENLNGIENLINLEYLWCYRNKIENLNPIKNLTNLKQLSCGNNQLKNLKGIENLINLEKLFCHSNPLTNLNEIENLTNLELINCKHINFTNEYEEYLINYCKEKNIKLVLI